MQTLEVSSRETSELENRLRQWMCQAQVGDSEAYLQLLRNLEVMVLAYTRKRIKGYEAQGAEAAEDLTQEILLAIHAKRHTYDPSQRFLPWVYAISRYKLIDLIRRNRSRMALGRAQAVDELPENLGNARSAVAVLSSVDENDSGLDVQALLSLLPVRQQEVLRAVKLDGLSIEEAAAQTGLSESNVKVMIHRAIKTLQKKIRGSRRGGDEFHEDI